MAFLFSRYSTTDYASLENGNGDEVLDTALRKVEKKSKAPIFRLVPYVGVDLRKSLLLIFSLFSLLISLTLGYLVLFSDYPAEVDNVSTWQTAIHTEQSCREFRVRKEWRTLTRSEKTEYISAVQCLRERPATIANRSLYDDFPYVHKQFGSYSHKSAAFLPWHRYFILFYENSLRKECGYTGGLPYWDWTLDWKNMTQAPIFDSTVGFGGDGDPNGEITVGGGRCVIDGPFAGLEALRYDADFQPHCLSRGFLYGELLKRLCGDDIHPDKIKDLLRIEDFKGFMHELEEGPHIAISTGIRGDWLKFTVPYGMSNGYRNR